MPRKYTPQERIIAFWSKAALTANSDKCWIWSEKNWSCKLTREQVAEIRLRYATEKITQRKLAAEYGVTSGRISQIVLGKSW